jgi:GTPase SAR1 family protein
VYFPTTFLLPTDIIGLYGLFIVMHPNRPQEILGTLQNAMGLLELDCSHPLRQSAIALEQSLQNANFRIAVFGPFNYGKSTLLNAILGDRTLPIDLIPTTGAAITVRYGEQLKTEIRLKTGQIIAAENVEILKDYAILDAQRRMREDVTAVEVYCPHPWLKTGVELLDLPGTDDQEAQDALVRDRLLTADLVVQVLDGRKMMTLGEREHLRDWLLDRGIETVVFVVNFLNLLEPEEQKQVAQRMRFVAESFRAKLPPGVSNLYRVDALPALRSRLKGDMAAAQTSGLVAFESALQAIAAQPQPDSPRCLRQLQDLGQQVRVALDEKVKTIEQEIQQAAQHQSEHRLTVQRKAQSLIQSGYQDSVTSLRKWLTPSKLYQTYESGLMNALGHFEFEDWFKYSLQQDWNTARQELMGWVYRSCDFFKLPRPVELFIEFPKAPIVQLSDATATSTSDTALLNKDEVSPVAIATGLGWLVGGPVGAAVLGGASYFLNQIPGSSQPSAATDSSMAQEWESACQLAAQTYLQQFQHRALAALDEYETRVREIIQYPLNGTASLISSPEQHHLNLLRSMKMALEQEQL